MSKANKCGHMRPYSIAGASLSNLYTSTSSFSVYQVAVDLSSVVYDITVTGGLPVWLRCSLKLASKPVQACRAGCIRSVIRRDRLAQVQVLEIGAQQGMTPRPCSLHMCRP